MGAEYEVSYYQDGCYQHFDFFEELVDAITAMEKLRDKGIKCIKLEWRPDFSKVYEGL